MSETIIEVRNLCKDYYIYGSNLRRAFGILFGLKPKETRHALKDISFVVKKGERVAIIGNPESGKSTLQKIIAGTAYPTKGKVKVRGSVNAFLNRRVGFDYKFTCRENIYLKAAALDIKKKDLKEKEEEILMFADVGRLADLPMDRAEKGVPASMALEMHLQKPADILIIDENIAAGGDRIIKKNEKRLKKYIKGNENITLIISNQRIKFLKALCNRAIILDKGKIIYDGSDMELVSKIVKRIKGK